MITVQQLAARRAELLAARELAETPPEVLEIDARLGEIKYLMDLNFNKAPEPVNFKIKKLTLEMELLGMKPSDYDTILLESDYSTKNNFLKDGK